VSIVVYAPSGQCLIDLESEMAGFRLGPIPKRGFISCRIKRLPLAPGEYCLNIYCESNGEIVDWVQNATTFDVQAGEFFGTGKLPPATHGGLLVDQEWEVSGA
jgi:lipopolysaccharide transport system ATP-binding protein